jgi:hypothetical protein
MLRLLADLARSGTSDKPLTVIADEVDSWRRRISQKIEDMQSLIESSKFESGDLQVDAIQKCTGDGQIIFVLLLSLARQSPDTTRVPDAIRAAMIDLENSMTTALKVLANHISARSEPAVPELEHVLNAFERSVVDTDALNEQAVAHLGGRLALYRTLVGAIKKISLEPMTGVQDGYEARVLAAE